VEISFGLRDIFGAYDLALIDGGRLLEEAFVLGFRREDLLLFGLGGGIDCLLEEIVEEHAQCFFVLFLLSSLHVAVVFSRHLYHPNRLLRFLLPLRALIRFLFDQVLN